MSDYRDPKVTKTGDKKDSGMGKWIGIAVAVLLALLLLGWLLGWFGAEEAQVDTVDPVVTEEVDPVVTEDPAAEVEPEVVE